MEPYWRRDTASAASPNASLSRRSCEGLATPWQAPTEAYKHGRFTKNGVRVRSFSIATPLDGNVEVRVDSWTCTPYSVVLRDPASGSIVASGRGVTVTGCGGRLLRVDVRRRGAAAAFDLTVSKP